jgi:hypothetical protein
VKKTRVAKNGEVPVILRVTVNRLRAETSVNLKVDPKKGNAVAGRSIGDTRKDDEVNARLDTIRMRVMQIHREMEIDREKISAQRVIDCYLGRDTKPVIMLLDLFREHNEKCRKPISIERLAVVRDVFVFQCFTGLISSGVKDLRPEHIVSGIAKIVDSCKVAGLPTQEIKEQEGGFIVTLSKDRFTVEQLQKLGLNERQVKAVMYVKEQGRITSAEYQTLYSVAKKTATNDLSELVEKHGLLKQLGASVGIYYELA